MNKFDPTSHNITDEQKMGLKTLFPEAFTEQGIDFDRLKTLLGEVVEAGSERYSFTWPGKTEAIRAAQATSMGTLVPDKDSSVDWDTTENLYLEGDNLEILKLLQKSYTGKVKMIYIDPPYNTGKDFVYPDNFGEGLKTYLEYTGQIDGDGKKLTTNTETDGRYHSKWLNMMYPRLMLARNLLKEDGVIFASIDDHEVHNLRKIMDEIFGAENLMGQMVWHARGRSKTPLSIDHEYVLVYAKKILNIIPIFDAKEKEPTWWGQYIERKYSNPDNDARGEWRDAQHTVTEKKAHYTYSINSHTGEVLEGEIKNDNEWYGHRTWMYPINTIKNLFEDNRLVFNALNDHLTLKVKKFKSEETAFSALEGLVQRDEISSRHGTEELLALFNGKEYFEYPKPTELIKRFIAAATHNDDLIMDFFSGSGTTAHSVVALNMEDGGNRRFILSQLQEPTLDNSMAKIDGYANIAEIGKERIRRAGVKIREGYTEEITARETPLDIGFKTYRLAASTFNVWNVNNNDDIQQKLIEAMSLIENEAKEEDVLTELILKSGYGLTEKVKEFTVEGRKFYRIAEGALTISLQTGLTLEIVRQIAEMKPTQFVARESGFVGDDLLTNTTQIMKDKGIDFRVL